MMKRESNFFLLDTQDATFPCRWIENEPYLEDIYFEKGQLINTAIPQPLEFSLEPLDELASDCGPEMPAYFDTNYPLFRVDFLAAIREFGVNNLQTFEATIFDPDSNKLSTNYKAVNIIGLVKAADMNKSVATVHDKTPLIDVSFDKLVLNNEAEASNLMIFRLAEKSTAILVRRDLKEFLVERGFDHVCFGDLSTSAL